MRSSELHGYGAPTHVIVPGHTNLAARRIP